MGNGKWLFIFWQKFRKGKVSGQIALLFTLFIAVVFLFIIITINVGILGNKRMLVRVAADTGALTMASSLGSWAYYLSQTYIGGDQCDCDISLTFIAILILTIIAWEANFGFLGGAAQGLTQIVMQTLAVIGTAYVGYQQYVLNPKAMAAFNRDSQKLGQNMQISESGIRTALMLGINDPKKVPDQYDIDEDGDTTDEIPRFYVWYKKRMIDLIKLQNTAKSSPEKLVNQLKSSLRDFLGKRTFGRRVIVDKFGAVWLADFLEDDGQSDSWLGDLHLSYLLRALERPTTDPSPGLGVDVSFYIQGENFDFSSCAGLPSVCPAGITNPADCKSACQQDILTLPPNDSMDKVRYMLGYSQYVVSDDTDTANILINQEGIIPQIEQFLTLSSTQLVSTFWSWRTTYYNNGNPEDANYPLPPEQSGGMYKTLGGMRDQIENWRIELQGYVDGLEDPNSPYYNLNFARQYSHDMEEAIKWLSVVEENIDQVRDDIKTIILELEDMIEEEGSLSQALEHEAFYGWKDTLGWHFAYVEASQFKVPYLHQFTKDHVLWEENCIEVRWPFNDVSDDWAGNPVTLAVMRYDQANKELSLLSGNLKWMMVYRPSQEGLSDLYPGGVPDFDEPTTQELDAADTEGIFEKEKEPDGVLTHQEIVNAGLATRIKNLLKYYSINSYARGVYHYKQPASLKRTNYSWDGAGTNSYKNVQINLF